MGCPIAKLDSLRKRTALIPLLTVAIGFFLIGCIPVTGEVGEVQAVFPCDRLGMSHWEEFDFGPVSSLDGFLATVDQLYGVDSDVLHSIKNPEGQVTEVNWTDSNSGLAAHFFGDGRLADIQVLWAREQPTLAQVISCLGPPVTQTEVPNSDGAGAEIVSYWTAEKGPWRDVPGYVTMLILKSVSWLYPEISSQAGHPEYRIKELTVFTFPELQRTIVTSERSSCVRLSASRWQEFKIGVDSSGEIYEHVVKLWGDDKGQIDVSGLDNDGSRHMNWSDRKEEIHYTAYLEDGKLNRIYVGFEPAFGLGLVIDCLGSPEQFSAYYSQERHSKAVTLELWYEKEGFVVLGRVHHSYAWQTLPDTITADYRLDRLLVFTPGLEEMAYRLSGSAEGAIRTICTLKPWPGSIEGIEIEELDYSKIDACEEAAPDWPE